MYGKKYSKFLTIILILIIIAIIGLLGYLTYSYYKKNADNSDASSFVDEFPDTVATEDTTGGVTPSENQDLQQADVDESSGKNGKFYKGFEVIGTIEIPKINLKYPVLKELSTTSLDTAVVGIYPKNPVLNSVGNVVIAGHNYRNGQFFSNNKKLSKEDTIYITDLDNNRIAYKIYDMFETTAEDTKSYNRDTDGKREITLSTCTDDSSRRLVILAREE